MHRILWTFLSLYLIGFQAFAEKRYPEQLTPQAKVYLITCGPGNEIWSHFGHSGIRVHDAGQQPVLDIVFNWGMFDYEDPAFTWKFAKRTANYFLEIQNTQGPGGFVQAYANAGRYVYQQELLLDAHGRQEIYAKAIQDNSDPKTKNYLYEFFFDNCATRPRDFIEYATALTEKFDWAKHKDANKYTFRDLIDKGFRSSPWVDFGIDLVLGSNLDRPVTNHELMFLPIYLAEIAGETTVFDQPLVGPIEYLYEVKWVEPEASWLTPDLVFWVLFTIMFVLTLFYNKPKLMNVLDTFFFTLFGALGIFLLFMWFGTDHQGTKNNYNLLWAHPLHLVTVAFIFVKRLRELVPPYYLVMAVILFIFILCFWAVPQEFPPASKPIVFLLAFRYYSRAKGLGYKLLPSRG